MTRHSGHNAKLIVTGTSTAMTEEATTVVSGTSNQVWQITDATKDILDYSVTFTVEASEDSGATWTTLGTDEYTLQYLLGRVDIDNYTSASGTVANVTDVRISGSFLEQFERDEVYSSSHEKMLNLEETSAYNDQGEHRTPIRQDFTASVDDYDRGDTELDTGEGSILDYVLDGRTTVFSLNPNRDSDGVIRAWVRIGGDSTDQPGDAVITDSIDFEGSQKTAEMSSQTASVWNYRAPTS